MIVIKLTARFELLCSRNVVAGVFENKLSFSEISGSSNASSDLATDIHNLVQKRNGKIWTFENLKNKTAEKCDFSNWDEKYLNSIINSES